MTVLFKLHLPSLVTLPQVLHHRPHRPSANLTDRNKIVSVCPPASITKIVKPLPVILPKFAPPPNTPVSTNDILWLLDDWFKPGVPLSQFHAHFALCECSLVMTTRGFDMHQCLVPLDGPGPDDKGDKAPAPREEAVEWGVIDLTTMDEAE